MLKKISLILLTFVLAYSQVGYYFVMHHHQYLQKDFVKQKILNQLNEAQLEVISLADNHSIIWEEKGEEFLFNGQMYDVVKTKTVNGKTMLYCINDKKEKALIDNYNLITKQNSSSDKKGKNTIDNSINLFVCSEEKQTNQFSIPASSIFYTFVSPLTKIAGDKTSPPPKA